MRTVGSFSINSPHTGVQSYAAGVKPIPVACITIEDAAMFERMQARGQTLGSCVCPAPKRGLSLWWRRRAHRRRVCYQ